MKTLVSGLINLAVIVAVSFTGWQAAVAQSNEEVEKQTEVQIRCMALNIYYESRSSNRADRIAVADVVINRVNDARYPDTVCDVVKQGKKNDDGSIKRNACQFSWYCDGKSDWPTDNDAWVDAQMIAYNMLQYGQGRGLTEGATHYHATYVKPQWTRELQLVGRIGAHIFYRWDK